MIIYRHKWYKFNFRTYIPLLTVLNLIVAAVVLYILYSYRGNTTFVNW